MTLELQSHIAAAALADRFSEADTLQGELDAAAADAAARESAHQFTDGDLGTSLQSLTSQAASYKAAAAAEPKSSSPSPTTDTQDKSIAQPAPDPQSTSPDTKKAAENGGVAALEADAGARTKLQHVAAAEAALPASAQAQQRPDSSGSRQQLATIGLSRQLTDERTLSGYITDSDSAAEATPTVPRDRPGSGAQLPSAGRLQSAQSREALSAGVSTPVQLHVSYHMMWA